MKLIPYGTKIIYHGKDGWKYTKGYCGNYNREDDTYNLYNGWDMCHIPKNLIEICDWK